MKRKPLENKDWGHEIEIKSRTVRMIVRDLSSEVNNLSKVVS